MMNTLFYCLPHSLVAQPNVQRLREPRRGGGGALGAEAAKTLIHLSAHLQFGVVPINAAERIERLLAQAAVQPGMGSVWASILCQTRDSAEFYIKVG